MTGATHPALAAGVGGFYIAAQVDYFCPEANYLRYEVYRMSLNVPTPGWTRILTETPQLRSDDILGVAIDGYAVSARDIVHPMMAVAQMSGHDVVILVGPEAGDPDCGGSPSSTQKVFQYRLENADAPCQPDPIGYSFDHDQTCDGKVNERHQVDLPANCIRFCNCDGPTYYQPRNAGWQLQPAAFAGGTIAPDSPVPADSRVGIIWYEQPYRTASFPVPQGGKDAWTVVRGAWSADAGAHYSFPFDLTVPNGEGPPQNDNIIGQYFEPCADAAEGDRGYYGDYIGGAFTTASPWTLIAAAWTDSRLGCPSRDNLADTWHQHVYAYGISYP